MYPRRVFSPARRIWKLWLNLPHLRPAPKSKPSGLGRSLLVIHQGIHHLSREGAGKKSKQVTLTSDAQVAFETLKKACLEAPVLVFANFDKPFLLETDASELGLGVVLLQKQSDGWYHPVAYVSWSLTIHECNYYSTKQEFLALKWVIVEQFQEYLHWKLFVVKTDNSPLTYIFNTPNLDATQHCWVESLAGFTFCMEYQKGRDNAVADALSCVVSELNTEAVKSILDGVAVGTAGRANAHDLNSGLRLTKEYISKLRKLLSKYGPLTCM